jgi:hypothetical protein
MLGVAAAFMTFVATTSGIVVLIVQGGRWTQKIDDALLAIADHEQVETSARIAADLAETDERRRINDALAKIQSDHDEFRKSRLKPEPVP